MSFFRQYLAPLITVLIFFLALFAVSIRIFLPSDMAAPAPISQLELNTNGVYSFSDSARFTPKV